LLSGLDAPDTQCAIGIVIGGEVGALGTEHQIDAALWKISTSYLLTAPDGFCQAQTRNIGRSDRERGEYRWRCGKEMVCTRESYWVRQRNPSQETDSQYQAEEL